MSMRLLIIMITFLGLNEINNLTNNIQNNIQKDTQNKPIYFYYLTFFKFSVIFVLTPDLPMH